LSLLQAKKLVESLPQEIKANASKEEAEKIKAALEAAGGTTQQEVKMRMTGMAMHVIRTDGFLALYNGLSASLCRQMTYSLTRFGIYETAKSHLGGQGPPPFYQKVLLAAVGGKLGSGALGPGYLRMDEPLTQLFSGHRFHWWACGDPGGHGERQVSSVCTTGAFGPCMMAFGVVASAGVLLTSLLASLPRGQWTRSSVPWLARAGLCATFLCQPLDVLKTRLMNSHGEYRGVVHCAMETAKLGPLAFYKGFVPAAVRLVPQTVLTFIFLEQLRKYFGIKVTT
ncbi:DIC protein, partial [Chloropsis hardwickii]|nr:DIC protein [Chloropsis hardwickii]